MFWINLVLLALSFQVSGESVTVGDLKISADHIRVSPASRELHLVGNVRVEHELDPQLTPGAPLRERNPDR